MALQNDKERPNEKRKREMIVKERQEIVALGKDLFKASKSPDALSSAGELHCAFLPCSLS